MYIYLLVTFAISIYNLILSYVRLEYSNANSNMGDLIILNGKEESPTSWASTVGSYKYIRLKAGCIMPLIIYILIFCGWEEMLHEYQSSKILYLGGVCVVIVLCVTFYYNVLSWGDNQTYFMMNWNELIAS